MAQPLSAVPEQQAKSRSGDEDEDENERECSRKTGKQGVPAVSRNLPPACRLEGWTAG